MFAMPLVEELLFEGYRPKAGGGGLEAGFAMPFHTPQRGLEAR
jgi:hypothetical protein